MILITGATGFIGSHLLPALHQRGYPLRVLIPPDDKNKQIPKKVPVEIAVCGINDLHNLHAALNSVDTIIHLASDETKGQNADLNIVDIHGTKTLLQACEESAVKRIMLVSHLGAEPASAYPLLKAKGIVEQMIINSPLQYSIIKTGPIFGERDHFLEKIQNYLKTLPLVYFLPDKGRTILHPLWVKDLISVMILSLDHSLTQNKTFSIGGPEYYALGELFNLLKEYWKLRQVSFSIPSSYARLVLLFWQVLAKNTPISSFDIDTVAFDRTAPIDNITKVFGILPYSLRDYLSQQRI